MAEFLDGSTQANSQIYTKVWVQDTCLKLRTGDNFFNGSTLCSSSEPLWDTPTSKTLPVQKARQKKTIYAGFDLKLFQMPDGEYYASMTSATEPAGRDAKSICIF